MLLTVVSLVRELCRVRLSSIVLIGGLFSMDGSALAALAPPAMTLDGLGLRLPGWWLATIAYTVAWLGVMIVYTPFADRLATRWVQKPPTLDSFRGLQQSRAKLILGIVVAWVLGGFLEEVVFRGIVLTTVESMLAAQLIGPIASGAAVCVAALGAGLLHFYQGPRAMVIVTQLSVLFGVLFVVSGHNLWAVILCHGLYDTMAFVRFAKKKSKYSDLDGDGASSGEE